MLHLPDALRGAFKEPLGPIYTDTEALLTETGTPLIAVGDVVTYHIRLAGTEPDVALIDGRTKREAVSEEITRVLGEPHVEVENAPGTLSAGLLSALHEAIGAESPTVIHVDGEEDLATVPAIIAAPTGASVVYGQPDEGMVHVAVTPDTNDIARGLLTRMEGDVEAALSILEE